ncbi:MAG: hypothetical protein AAFP89_05770 [Bacteroidota bacterium]
MSKLHRLLFFLVLLLCVPIFSHAQYSIGLYRAQWSGYKGLFFQPNYNLEMALQLTSPQNPDRLGFSFSFTPLSNRHEDFNFTNRNNQVVYNLAILRSGQASFGVFLDHKFLSRSEERWLQPTLGIESQLIIYSTTYRFSVLGNPSTKVGAGFESGFRAGVAITLIPNQLYIYTGLGRNFGTMEQIRREHTITGKMGWQPYTYWKPYFTLQHFFKS